MKEVEHIKAIPTKEHLGLSIGNFDGMHLGHQKLLGELKKSCLKNGLKFCVMTFIPHPHQILFPDQLHFMLNSYEERAQKFNEIGVDYLITLNFDRDFSTLSPEAFIAQNLLAHPGLKEVKVGYDFSFGEHKKGSQALLEKTLKDYQVVFSVQEKFKINQKTVSSTLIRKEVSKGKMQEVAHYLGHLFSTTGLVTKGVGRGKSIGIPTANFRLQTNKIYPAIGVYITSVIYKGTHYPSVTNIGHNPTFSQFSEKTMETYILDFNQDIYGEKVQTLFHKKLREEQRFSSKEELVAQIHQDISLARKFHFSE